MLDELDQPSSVDGIERLLDTLPTTITSTAIPTVFRLFDHAIRWSAKRCKSWAGAIGKASCICCWCCPMAVAH
jgi:hypothetical protein